MNYAPINQTTTPLTHTQEYLHRCMSICVCVCLCLKRLAISCNNSCVAAVPLVFNKLRLSNEYSENALALPAYTHTHADAHVWRALCLFAFICVIFANVLFAQKY